MIKKQILFLILLFLSINSYAINPTIEIGCAEDGGGQGPYQWIDLHRNQVLDIATSGTYQDFDNNVINQLSNCDYIVFETSEFLDFSSNTSTDFSNNNNSGSEATLVIPELTESDASVLFGACAFVLGLAFVFRLLIHQILNKR